MVGELRFAAELEPKPCWLSPCDCTVMWIVLLGVQLIPKCDNVCPSAKESEDKENLPKRTSAGGFKFTFSHSASAANGANGANSKSVAAQTSPASSNGSSSKNAALSPAVPAPKVGQLCGAALGMNSNSLWAAGLGWASVPPEPSSDSLTALGSSEWVRSHPTSSASLHCCHFFPCPVVSLCI